MITTPEITAANSAAHILIHRLVRERVDIVQSLEEGYLSTKLERMREIDAEIEVLKEHITGSARQCPECGTPDCNDKLCRAT